MTGRLTSRSVSESKRNGGKRFPIKIHIDDWKNIFTYIKLKAYVFYPTRGTKKKGTPYENQNSQNSDSYALENYSFEKELPWDFIDIKPGKEFLIQENKRLMAYSN